MTCITRTTLITTLVLGLLSVAAISAAAASGSRQSTMTTQSRAYLHSYNLDSSGLALEGYCPVSYFTQNAAMPGDPEFKSTFNDVDYHFASAEAKRTFDRNPEKYIPAFGGWCAFGMAIEDKFPIDPTNFKIVNGRLYVFLRNPKIDALEKWNQGDQQQYVARAEAHWKKVSR